MVSRERKYFSSNMSASACLSAEFTENSFSDVTLISDDLIPIKTHRIVLSLLSPVLKNILIDNPHPHPLIFLRGVNHQELYSIIQYIYLGETVIHTSNINRLTQTVEDLQIKRLIDLDLYNNYEISKQDTNQDNVAEADDENIFPSVFGRDELGSGKQIYKCGDCEASYKSQSGLYHHTSSRHGCISYSCNNCQYSATRQSNLKRHQESVHEGVKYPCSKCDYQATDKGNLRLHQKAVHEGVRYFCDQCKYHTGRKQQLKRHKERNHGKLIPSEIRL